MLISADVQQDGEEPKRRIQRLPINKNTAYRQPISSRHCARFVLRPRIVDLWYCVELDPVSITARTEREPHLGQMAGRKYNDC